MTQHRYVLQARAFVGPLSAPQRNELQTASGDDREQLEALADDWRERGWRVWLYERREGVSGSLDVTGRSESFHVLTEWRETGQETK